MGENERKTSYEDILYRTHPTSAKHPRMSLYDRAAQFSPFAALTGHEAAISETGRLTEGWAELTEDQKGTLDATLQQLYQRPEEERKVTITYFVPDAYKDGGRYVTDSGIIKKIDSYGKEMTLADGRVIPMDYIREILISNEI